jgi:hypothetical protein
MNKKNVQKVLRKKFNHFLESIKDSKVKRLVDENSIITGGCIASMLLGEKINDFDIYFTNKETTKAVAKYYVKEFCGSDSDIDVIEEETGRINILVPSEGIRKAKVKSGEETKDEEKYKVKFITSNAISLANKVQLVIRFYGNADEIHKNYDFTHVTNYWESTNGKLTLRQDALESLLARELRYQGSLYPVCSVIRTRKFLKRDWKINAGQYLKMCFQISLLDLTDINVLKEQLIGVDTTYFEMMISSIQEDLESGKQKNIDMDYLSRIIDRIF